MANYLQIFVFALALAQGYCGVAISTMPATIAIVPPVLLPPVITETKPLPLPVEEVPVPVQPGVPEPLPLPEPVQPEQPAVPPCVSVVKSLLQAIIDKLENLPDLPVTLPEIVEDPSVPVETPEFPEVPQVPEIPEVPVVQGNPCTACFEHINSLLVTAQRLATLRALTRQ